jgi:hypothetical protein
VTRIGEIIESSATGFVAECYELYGLPVFGSMVKTVEGGAEIYGIVCQASTTSIEPGRRPIARGKGQESEADIYAANPQLGKLLRSEFRALAVGYVVEGRLYRRLPPRPARIHGFVLACSAEEVVRFGGSFDFLSLLLAPDARVPAEELTAAALRELSRAQPEPRAFLVAAGKALTAVLGNDYVRLKVILARLGEG